MLRTVMLGIAATVFAAGTALAEGPHFHFQKGHSLSYTVLQMTKVDETTIDEKTSKPVEHSHMTKHTVTRRWKVTDMDAKSVATLEMTIDSMRWEQRLPNGETEIFDSTNPDDLNKKEMAQYIGSVLAVLRVDETGKVVEIKQTKHSSPNRFLMELPFKVILPGKAVLDGESWTRAFQIKLDPPHGTGETYDAVQTFTSKPAVNQFLTIGITTSIKDLPAQASDQIPLLPMMLEGDVFFSEKNGHYHAARLKLKKELLNHAGEGTKYVFESVYVEDYKGE